jgi:acetyl-CoA carboxylase biotin carboxyl carrier protein
MVEELRAEMVASVLSVAVAPGATVAEGDTLLTLESMKMEIPVIAESGGTVTELPVTAGAVVREGDLLAVIG